MLIKQIIRSLWTLNTLDKFNITYCSIEHHNNTLEFIISIRILLAFYTYLDILPNNTDMVKRSDLL